MAKTNLRRSRQTLFRSFPAALTALAWLALAQFACGGTRAPEPPPKRILVAPPELLQTLAPTYPLWLFVPLPGNTPTPAQTSSRELQRITEVCLRESDAPGAKGSDGLLFCLNQRGFYPALCSDGVDNDGDGEVDFPADAGCAAPEALEEDPACDDGRDNDGDGLIDLDGGGRAHPDPGCESAHDPSEFDRGERRRRG